ncbi:hypothetical protein M2440_000320 [Methylorubrum extorquens]|nr:hypothetical protein [Methylorubrum extorquens]
MLRRLIPELPELRDPFLGSVADYDGRRHGTD